MAKQQKNVPTNLQDTSLKDQRALLMKRMQAWELVRGIYVPGLLQYQVESGIGGPRSWDDSSNPEDIELFLPSQLPSNQCRAICAEGIPEVEVKYRLAQCEDALEELRHALRIKTRMIQFKNQNIRGQVHNTRSRALIDRVHQRALASTAKYRAARAACQALDLFMPRGWDVRFPPLLDSDVRGYRDAEGRAAGPGRRGIWEDGREVLANNVEPSVGEDGADIPLGPTERARRDGTGQTRFKISWIWRMDGANAEEAKREGDYSSLRPDWARSRARVHRCKEELQLLLEEMRRTLDFLKYKADWWEERAASRATASPELAEGLSSYAASQADVQMSLSSSFVCLWKTPLGLINEHQVDEETEAAGINAAEPDVSLDDDADGGASDDDDDGEDDDGDTDHGDGDTDLNIRADRHGEGARIVRPHSANVHPLPADAEAAFFL